MILGAKMRHLSLTEFYKKIRLFSCMEYIYQIKHNSIDKHVHSPDTDSMNKHKKNHLIYRLDGLKYFVLEYVRILSNKFLLFFNWDIQMLIRRFCYNSSPRGSGKKTGLD